jgi:hypothetical protein
MVRFDGFLYMMGGGSCQSDGDPWYEWMREGQSGLNRVSQSFRLIIDAKPFAVVTLAETPSWFLLRDMFSLR